VQQSITAPDLTECPECKGEIRKVYSNVGVTFKGSGFYINDSGKPSKGSDS
jgi:putative FmdB family regulatory protein